MMDGVAADAYDMQQPSPTEASKERKGPLGHGRSASGVWHKGLARVFKA